MPTENAARRLDLGVFANDSRIRVWESSARYHREHGHPTAGNLAADVADAVRYYFAHLASPGFEKEDDDPHDKAACRG